MEDYRSVISITGIIKAIFYITGITFIGICIGLLINAAMGYLAIGIGYLILAMVLVANEQQVVKI